MGSRSLWLHGLWSQAQGQSFVKKRPSIGVKETYYRAESRGTVLASKLAATAPMAVDNIESMYYDMIRTFPNNNLQGFLLFSPCISALF